MKESFPQFLSRFDWIIFDADNTLFDYDAAEKDALFKTLKDFSINVQMEPNKLLKIYKAINSKLWKQLENGELRDQQHLKILRTKLLLNQIDAEANVGLFAETYLKNLSKDTRLIDHAHSVVQTLARTHSLAIITNGMTKVQRPRLEQSSIGKYFDYILISEEVGVSKPSEEIFALLFDAIGQPNRSKVLMIGDSLSSDIQGARNYGLQSIWYNPKNLKAKNSATHELDDLIDLIL